MNGLDAFERSIKGSLEQFEVPYNSADWTQLQQALDSSDRSSWFGSYGKYVAFGIGLLLLGGAIYLASPDGNNGKQALVAVAEDDQVLMDQAQDDQGTTAAINAVDGRSGLASEQQQDGPKDVLAGPATGTTTESTIEPVKRTTPGSDAKDAKKSAVPAVPAPVNADRAKAGKANAEEPFFRPSITEGCPGTVVEFNAEHLPESGIFLWNFGDGSFSNKPNPTHSYSKSGKFEVMLSHSSPGGGNIHNKPSADLIVIHEAPVALFNIQKQEYDGRLPSVHFENRSQGGSSYHWDFADGTTSKLAHPDHIFRKKGTYPVELVVTNANGCVDRKEKIIVVEEDYDLMAPKAFSPNGDGNYDLFIPEALRSLELGFRFMVYEPQTGRMVYETSDATKPWTGRFMNKGELCAPGTYVWAVEFKDGLHISESPFQGEVDLVR